MDGDRALVSKNKTKQKTGPDVSCHGALTIFLGQLNVGTITNLLGLFLGKNVVPALHPFILITVIPGAKFKH